MKWYILDRGTIWIISVVKETINMRNIKESREVQPSDTPAKSVLQT